MCFRKPAARRSAAVAMRHRRRRARGRDGAGQLAAPGDRQPESREVVQLPEAAGVVGLAEGALYPAKWKFSAIITNMFHRDSKSNFWRQHFRIHYHKFKVGKRLISYTPLMICVN